MGKLKHVVATGVLGSMLGMSVVYADTATPGEPVNVKADTVVYKFTPSYYVTTSTKDAVDINLRASYGPNAYWIGHYQRDNEFEQTRVGYEYTVQFSYLQLVPSLQLATHSFAGGSVNAQIGDPIYVLLGLGRTNTQDYYNLNFDPNDSVVYGVGTSLLPEATLSLFSVKDNRFGTGQVVTHLLWRELPEALHRWTVDISSKQGRAMPDDESVSGMAVSVTYDNRDMFFRLAQDNKVNFTPEDQMRFTVGVRF